MLTTGGFCLLPFCYPTAWHGALQPTTPHRGRPKKTTGTIRRVSPANGSVDTKLAERRKRYSANRAAKRAAARAQNGGNGSAPTKVSAKVFWRRAEKLEPTKQWAAVSREFGIAEAAAQSARRACTLPANINQVAAARFMQCRRGEP